MGIKHNVNNRVTATGSPILQYIFSIVAHRVENRVLNTHEPSLINLNYKINNIDTFEMQTNK